MGLDVRGGVVVRGLELFDVVNFYTTSGKGLY